MAARRGDSDVAPGTIKIGAVVAAQAELLRARQDRVGIKRRPRSGVAQLGPRLCVARMQLWVL